MKKILIITLTAILSVACSQSSTPTTSKNASTNANQTNQSTANSNTVQAKYFKGKGKVTKINLELVSVELNHEKIEGLMDAMIMEFYVKEKSQLEVLKVGDQVDFVLEDKAGAEIITEIKKAS